MPTGGPYRVARGEKGEGAPGLTAVERAAPLGRVRAAGEGECRGGELGRQRPKARGERGEKLGQGLGLVQIWCRGQLLMTHSL